MWEKHVSIGTNTLTSLKFLTIFSETADVAVSAYRRLLASIRRDKPEHGPVHTTNLSGLSYVRSFNAFEAGFIAFAAALNVTVGYLVSAFKLPLYLDSIGTVLVSVLFGGVYGVATGLTGLVVLALTTTPTVIAYAGTAVVIAVTTAVMRRAGFLKNWPMTIIGGIVVGIVAAAASIPVTTMLYGGVSLAGSDALTTLFKTAGLPLWQSVMYGSLVTDIIDKIATSLLCFILIKSFPARTKRRFPALRD